MITIVFLFFTLGFLYIFTSISFVCFFFFLTLLVFPSTGPLTSPLLYFDIALFSYMDTTLEDFKSFAFTAKEMNLLPQLYQ